MYFSNEERKKISQAEILNKLSEIETSTLNIQAERSKVQRLTEELMNEGVELIRVSGRLSEFSSVLHAENKAETFTVKEPVTIRKDYFPYDPQEYITGSFHIADFSQTNLFNEIDSERVTIAPLGSRKNRSKISRNQAVANDWKDKRNKRRRRSSFLPTVVFIFMFLLVLFIFDYFNPIIFPFVDTKVILNEIGDFFHK